VSQVLDTPKLKVDLDLSVDPSAALQSYQGLSGAERGVRTKSAKLLGRSIVSRVLSNPVYYGHFKYAGEVHEGTHEPLISKKLFDDAQAVLNRRFRYSPKDKDTERKVFLGLLRCAECGSAITGEIQKGHIYYRCTKKNRVQKCSQPYAREEALETEISRLLVPFTLREDWADEMLVRLESERKNDAHASTALAAQKRTSIANINARLQRLLDGFLDGIIDREAYTTEKSKLMSEKRTLEEQCTALSKGQQTWLEPMRKWILEAKSADKIALTGSPEQKRVLASKVFGSNLVLDCKKPCGAAIKPFALLREKPTCSKVVGEQGLELYLPRETKALRMIA